MGSKLEQDPSFDFFALKSVQQYLRIAANNQTKINRGNQKLNLFDMSNGFAAIELTSAESAKCENLLQQSHFWQYGKKKFYMG